MSGVTLAPDHAVELTELLEFLNAWLTSDHDQLNASLHRYVGHPAYDINRQCRPRPVRFPPRRRQRRTLPTTDPIKITLTRITQHNADERTSILVRRASCSLAHGRAVRVRLASAVVAHSQPEVAV